MKTRRPLLHPRAPRAFTLLETLLALMIFSMAVVSLVEAVNQLGLTTVHQRRESQVQERMRSLLTERTRLPLQQEEGDTKVQEGDTTYIVRHQKLQLQNKEGQPVEGLFEVTVTAQWMEGREPQQTSVDTWLYPPLFLQQNGGGGIPPPQAPIVPPPAPVQ
ncbi:MAG TPA: prepilin-type N-terminal cleavage/methylation domain-containing protein [Prosthecobacter sp.]